MVGEEVDDDEGEEGDGEVCISERLTTRKSRLAWRVGELGCTVMVRVGCNEALDMEVEIAKEGGEEDDNVEGCG